MKEVVWRGGQFFCQLDSDTETIFFSSPDMVLLGFSFRLIIVLKSANLFTDRALPTISCMDKT